MSRRRSGIMPRGKELDEYETDSEESYHPEEDEEIVEKKPKRKSEKTVTKKKSKESKPAKKATKSKTTKKQTKRATKPKRETRKIVNHLQEDIEDESGDENPRRRKPKIHKSMKDFVDDHEESMEEEEDEYESSEDDMNMNNIVDDEEDDEMDEMKEEDYMEEEDMNESSEFELYDVLEYNGSKNVEDEMMEEEENEDEKEGENKEDGEDKPKRGKQKRTKEQRELINKHRETVIYLNGFSDEEKKEYNDKLHAMKIITTEKIEKATHLVEKTNVKNIKTVFALCKGIWILKEEYLKQIIANKNFVEEEPYENDELPSCKEQRENHKDIFENIKIYMTRFTPKEMTRTELNQLMNLTGFIPERNPRNTKIHIGSLEGEVSLQWVFESILQNVILPFENYLN